MFSNCRAGPAGVLGLTTAAVSVSITAASGQHKCMQWCSNYFAQHLDAVESVGTSGVSLKQRVSHTIMIRFPPPGSQLPPL